MTFRFSLILIRFLTFFFIFVSLGLQTTHMSYDKNDVANFLSCDITPIFFSVRTYTKLEISLPPPTLSPQFNTENRLPYKVLRWKYVQFMQKQMFFIIGDFNNKETPTQGFSCGFCEYTFFTVAAYVHALYVPSMKMSSRLRFLACNS